MAENNLQVFEKKYMMAFVSLRDLKVQLKEAEEKEKQIKELIKDGMDEFGIDSIDNEYVRINRIPAYPGKPKLDEKAWRAEDPDSYNEIFNKYNKMSGSKKSYITINIKEEDHDS